MKRLMKIFAKMTILMISMMVMVQAQSNFKADQLQMVKYSGGGINGSFEKNIRELVERVER